MSKGGSFNVMINEQNPDDLINNNGRLLERVNEFNKRASGIILKPDDPNYISMQNSISPIVNFIEKTHHVFVNGSFKPNIPIGFQYTKVMAANPALGTRIEFDIKPYGDFWCDMVLNIQLTGLSAVDPRDRVRYATMIGHKIGTLYQFQSQGVKIDEYDYNLYNIHYNYSVLPEKKIGWMRCMGQEIPITGYLTPDPTNDMYREYRTIGNGFQTLKQKHDVLDLWIPILFWFRDVKYAFPQIIADGQTKIIVQLANIQDLVGVENLGGGGKYNIPNITTCDLYVNNLFMQDDVFQLFLKNFSFSLIRVNTYQLNTITSASVNNVKLYGIRYPVENLFIGFRPQSNATLSQYWDKYCKLTKGQVPVAVMVKNQAMTWTGTTLSATSTQVAISGMDLSITDRFYINYYFVITGGTGYNASDVTQNQYLVTAYSALDATHGTLTVGSAWTSNTPSTDTTWELYTLQPGRQYVEYYTESPVIDQLEIRAFNIPLRGPFSEQFFNKYLPTHYGNGKMSVPQDPGLYIINFNLYPLNSNPSGHIDFTQTRENYLYWTSNIISEANPVDLVIYSRSINFLILKDSSARLRYSY